MVTKYPKFTYKKGSVFYYSRVIPKDLINHYDKKRVVLCLRTTSYHQARLLSETYSNKLEQFWLGLRLKQTDVPGLNLIKTGSNNKYSTLPTIEDAKQIYLKVKGKDKNQLFVSTTNRNIRYVIECLGMHPLDCYSTKDAAKLREWLLCKNLKSSTLRRIFSGIRAVVNFCIQEQGLECSNAFAKVYLPSNIDTVKRKPISVNDIKTLVTNCIQIDDDIRHIVALIVNTGIRLSEAIGLLISDIDIESKIPNITITPHPHRRLKTQSSKRQIPLTGISLWAARRIIATQTSQYCFPRYTSSTKCNANSASASINKWLKTVGNQTNVIHGLRHSFKDRLREVEAPMDIIEQLGGWSNNSKGYDYGDGYSLELSHKYLNKIDRQLPS